MDEQVMLEQLEQVAKGLEVEIRYETMRKEAGYNPGGLCRIHGVPLIIVNRKAPLGDKVQVLASAIKRFDLTGIYLRPGLRDFLERAEPGRTVRPGEIGETDENGDGEE
ncbi:MAG: hypothetical protein ACQET7_03210 [Thermodesulfobacteriota bacterium]